MRLYDLFEAPIGDYAPLGNWGDREKSNSFSHAQDRKIIQSPALVQKVRKKFSGVEQTINMYFVNLQGLRKHAESGVMTPEQISNDMPKVWELLSQRIKSEGTDINDSINIVYVGNAGVNRVPMTAWIMAHRLGHAARASGNKLRSWEDFSNEFIDIINHIMDQVYGVKFSKNAYFTSKFLAKFFERIGTMGSARNAKLGGRPYEFFYEMFAQYLLTGHITFRELPEYFATRDKHIRAVDKETLDAWNQSLTDRSGYDIVDQLEERAQNILYDMEGKFLVM